MQLQRNISLKQVVLIKNCTALSRNIIFVENFLVVLEHNV